MKQSIENEINRLFLEAEACIKKNDLKGFKKALEATYEEEYVNYTPQKIKTGWGNNPDFNLVKTTERKQKNFLSHELEFEKLLGEAQKNNAVPIVAWLLENRPPCDTLYASQEKQYFADFCNKNKDNKTPEAESICQIVLNTAIKDGDYNWINIILETSPIYKDNQQLLRRLDIIEPLFAHFKAIDTMASKEKSAELEDFSRAARAHVSDFITGKIDGQAFEERLTKTSEKAMGKLQEQSEGVTILKNFLFALTIIGPAIKAAMGYGAGFDNTTTVKVRDTKNAVMDMKEELMRMKQEQKQPEKTDEEGLDASQNATITPR